jgi:hypothetical protein
MILALESASNLAEICVNLTLSVNHDLISASLVGHKRNYFEISSRN